MKKLLSVWHISSSNKKMVLVLLISWFVAIFILSAIPGNRYPKVDFPLADKLMHIHLYCWGGLLAAAYFSDRRFWIPLGLIAIYGITDEFHQLFVPNRSFSFNDWLADLAGAGLGFYLCRQLDSASARVSGNSSNSFDNQIMESS